MPRILVFQHVAAEPLGTLDPLIRQVRLPDRGELLLSDTVGFIDRLPHALVAAFRATLEEVAEAAWRAVHEDQMHWPVGKTARRIAFGARWLPGRVRKQSRERGAMQLLGD